MELVLWLFKTCFFSSSEIHIVVAKSLAIIHPHFYLPVSFFRNFIQKRKSLRIQEGIPFSLFSPSRFSPLFSYYFIPAHLNGDGRLKLRHNLVPMKREKGTRTVTSVMSGIPLQLRYQPSPYF